MTGGSAAGKAPPRLRSFLHVPGLRRAALEDAARYHPDALWIDLEDPSVAITLGERRQMRREVAAYLRSPSTDRPLCFVRIQSIATHEALLDLRAVVGPGLDGVILPKANGPEEIAAVDALLTNCERDADVPVGKTWIYPILESASALRSVSHIAAASPRVGYLGGAVSRFGDLVQAVGYRWTQPGRETLMLRAGALVDVRAAHRPVAITGNWGGRTDDSAGFRAWMHQCRDLGYDGSMTAHGPFVAIIHEVFNGSPELRPESALGS